ncbi:helix-turn-helix protein [Herbihabitans rhizosphaerae]|uniref:Helix-turn-helix protein n=1 Tax=Herbihabitans rhizosphaerae TaxID=1872711 RepID=A0A4Q7KSE0_9PSEU|nr:helix-turn-helix transcriptional regulator [Herbihabitans rhizosphaerae]RZS39030.1 helix-turn-helix protein [Herbihabitans rhizosphaerae]
MADWSIVVPHAEVARLSELIAGTPDPRLGGYVLTYTAHDYTHLEPMRWRIAQVGAITLSIDLEAPARVRDGGSPHPRNAVTGLRDRPMTLIEAPGRTCGITVGLTPAGAHAVLGVPLAELANTNVDLVEVLGVRAHRLIERLGAADCWAERFRLLDEQLVAWVRDGPRLAVPVYAAWARLTGTAGRTRIDALAEEIGWTRQHLGTRFRQQIGLAPKTVARVARLHRAATLIAMPDAPSWSEIAHRCGYADQAHLNRDFRELTGSTPSDYAPVDRLPFTPAS